MARPTFSSTGLFIRQNPKFFLNHSSQFKKFVIIGCTNEISIGEKPQQLREVVEEICGTIRSKPRWEHSILSDFPGVNFLDASFLNEVVRHQNNVFLSVRLLYWLNSKFQFSPDKSTCSLIFDALLKARAAAAARQFMSFTKFVPEPASLDVYARRLCESQMMNEALEVLDELKKQGNFASLETCNCLLRGFVRGKRADMLQQLYSEMSERGVGADATTLDCLVQVIFIDENASKGYELLRQLLEDGHLPPKKTFDKVIFHMFRNQNFVRASAVLHIMISKGINPDILTYQQIICGLCNRQGNLHEALRIFDDIKTRGYAPNRIMYKVLIHSLCEMRQLGCARKLWFEMIQKGIKPNQDIYNILINAYLKGGYITEAQNLYKEMCDSGCRVSTITPNIMISGLCLRRRTGAAFRLFKLMPQKGIARDVITYNGLISGFCKEGKLAEGLDLFHKLVKEGLQPSSKSFGILIRNLCKVGCILEAKTLWDDMQNRGIKPGDYTYDCIIIGLCKGGYIGEAISCLADMIRKKHVPRLETLEKFIYILSQRDKVNDASIVLPYMFKTGYRSISRDELFDMRLLQGREVS